MAQEAHRSKQINRLHLDAGAGQAHGSLHLQEAAYPAVRKINFLLVAAARLRGADLESLGADAEGGGSAGAQLTKRAPEPGGEIDVGGAAHDFAHRLEHGRVDNQRRVG
jgi:hypothetical protein